MFMKLLNFISTFFLDWVIWKNQKWKLKLFFYYLNFFPYFNPKQISPNKCDEFSGYFGCFPTQTEALDSLITKNKKLWKTQNSGEIH